MTLASLGAASPASAGSGEAGRYRFEAFLTRAEDPRLPVELRAHASRTSSLPAELQATDRAVEIEWVSRESAGLRGYRLTTTIDGGPLSGVAARWTVAPGTGEPGGASGPRVYRMRLPLPVDGQLRLHTALEAVREDGTAVLLAITHSTPARTKQGTSLGAPAGGGVWPSDPHRSAAFVSSTADLPSAPITAHPGPAVERGHDDRRAVPAGDAVRPGRPRGPPGSAC